MTSVYSDADFTSNFDAIAEQCCRSGEPAVIRRDGRDALALVKLDDYEKMCWKLDLYAKLAGSRKDIAEGRVFPLADVMAELRGKIIDGTI